MLTLRDCIGLADLDDDEVFAIAQHEHLPDIVAVEKAHAFLQQDWGAPAVRQMILDEVRKCLDSGDCRKAAEAMRMLEKSLRSHPGGQDRRVPRKSGAEAD